MATLLAAPILTFPDARLRQVAAEITQKQGLEKLRDCLIATMQSGVGGVGIAAPQIGQLVRMVVVDCRGARHPCAHHGLLCMVNPRIVTASGHKLGREGCLSVPDLVATVSRNKNISVCYQDVVLNTYQIESSGFEARVMQHEIDHLQGVLLIDRVTNVRDIVRRMAQHTA
ncbi:MAG: peptide deformylase [Mariprofundales bacterium]|nr:peptide deformylase [Mariprofundales bacterium]